jgi:hypothetical protein
MNTALWNKILAFNFDDPPGEYSFSTRLANENFWTKNFTEQAILEYRKFMYLAASSEFMVSPSEIIDTAWHQHLIFTQSYQEFCGIIGKQVQHVPSTHTPGEMEKFRQAKERTKKIYQENFGEQPYVIWECAGMYESLHLDKAKWKIRTFLVGGILGFFLLIVPFYYLLRPLYVKIGNPGFIPGLLLFTLAVFITLELFNRHRLKKIIDEFDKNAFIYHLEPLELVYLKTQKLRNVINGVVNELVEDKLVQVHADNSLEMSGRGLTKTLEQLQTMNVLHDLGKTFYPKLLRQLSTKPVFWNTANSMSAFKKYFNKSKKFGALFYINFSVLALLVMFALVRLSTGILREKPVTQIAIAVIVLIILMILYLNRLTRLVCTHSIPAMYQNDILPLRETGENWQWSYFLLGSAALATSFVPLVNYVEKNKGIGAGSGSSCGTSGESSCGSSCSSCGGCGGD